VDRGTDARAAVEPCEIVERAQIGDRAGDAGLRADERREIVEPLLQVLERRGPALPERRDIGRGPSGHRGVRRRELLEQAVHGRHDEHVHEPDVVHPRPERVPRRERAWPVVDPRGPHPGEVREHGREVAVRPVAPERARRFPPASQAGRFEPGHRVGRRLEHACRVHVPVDGAVAHPRGRTEHEVRPVETERGRLQHVVA